MYRLSRSSPSARCDNDDVAWYTWVFSGVGAAIAGPLVAWLVTAMKQRSAIQQREIAGESPDTPKPGDSIVAAGNQKVHSTIAVQPEVTVPRTKSSPAGRLVDALLDIPGMDDPTFRRTVYQRIPPAVTQQLHLDRPARIELISLIDTFSQYPQLEPWPALLERLNELLPAHPAVSRLSAELADLGLIGNSRSGHGTAAGG
jgi:Effector-associated domain 2